MPTRWFPLLLLLIAVSITVTGELSLKHGMNRVGVFDFSLTAFWRTFTNPFVLLGFALVFLGSLFWLGVISRVPLSYAYPLLSLGYVLTVLASRILLGETVPLRRWLGVLVIVVGVILVAGSEG